MLHALASDYSLNANSLGVSYNTYEVITTYLTDPQGNRLTDPQGNHLVIRSSSPITVLSLLHALASDYTLNAE